MAGSGHLQHRGKSYIIVQTNCHTYDKGINNARQEETIYKLGTNLTLLFKLP
jgi:pyruvate/2-oxoacid:ferredoxin oxidoreductase beta subunit